MTPKEEQANARSEADLVKLARKRGYPHPIWWAKKVVAGRQKKDRRKKEVTFKGKPI